VGNDPGRNVGETSGQTPLRALVDTNVLVRLLTQDSVEHTRKVRALLRRIDELVLTDLIFAEVIFVLESFYEWHARTIAEAMTALLGHQQIAVVDHSLLVRALDLYVAKRIDYADAYVAAVAELSGIRLVASFDRALDRVPTIERLGS